MALLHSTVHTSPQSEDNTTLVGLRKQSQAKEAEVKAKEKENRAKEKESKTKEIHITVYTSDEESLAGQEVKSSQKEKKTKEKEKAAGSTTMASNQRPTTQFKVGEGCFAKVKQT